MTPPQIARLRTLLSPDAQQRVNAAMLAAYAWTIGRPHQARAAAIMAGEELACIAEAHALATRFRRIVRVLPPALARRVAP